MKELKSKFISTIQQNKLFFKELWKLALPLALQNLVATSLNLLDTFMIGQLGEVAIAAVALSNQIFFLQILLLFGISSGSSVFTSQFWGKKDIEGIHRSIGLALSLGLIGSLFFTLIAQIYPAQILGIFSKDQELIAQGIPYLKITSLSYIFTAITIIYQGVLRSTGHVKLPLFVSVGALSLNAIFNYILIFGHLGLPALGSIGAAIATTGARIVEMTLLLIITYSKKYPVAASVHNMFKWSRSFVARFIKKVSPVILNEVGWSLGITAFTFVYARMGTDVLATYNITDTVTRLSFVLFIGTANAAGIVLGNMIGRGEKRKAQESANAILFITPLVALLFSIILFALAPFIPHIFKVSPHIQIMISQFLRVASLVIFVRVSNMHIIVGILRSGGDTLFCALIELIPMWGLAIPIVAITGLLLHLPPPLVYALAMSEEVLKFLIGLKRVKSGKWVHDLTTAS